MLHWLGLITVVLGLVDNATLGKVIRSASDVLKRYDFVVVGGGTAGNVIANRLTEDPDIQVLVIEAGGSHEGAQDLEVPFPSEFIYTPGAWTWSSTTTPQSGLAGRSVPYIRGCVLGGSSSRNGMVYTRGSAEDWDMIANITGDKGWSWNQLQHYIRKHERWSSPTSSPILFDPSVHGFDGMVSVSLPRTPHSIDNMILEATKGNNDFPFNVDHNSGNPLGIGWQQSTITSDGRRDSSATSYLGPRFIQRANLHVLLNHQVLRLLPAESSTRPGVYFNTVEFREVADGFVGPQHLVTASKEIVLSAGSVGTPHILLHSGIGDSSALSGLGISPIHHLPSVGQNFTDESLAHMIWLVNDTNTFDRFRRNGTIMARLMEEWEVSGTGPLSDSISTYLGFLRLAHNASIFETTCLVLSDDGSRNGGWQFPPPTTGDFLSIATLVVAPMSRGSISLKSPDPSDQPLIDPALLVHEFDRFAARAAFRLARKFVTLPVWKDYILEPYGPSSSLDFNDDLDEYIKAHAFPGLHSVGSASMSPRGARWGVTDPDLRVKGVRGIRVVDASVIPHVPSAHTQAPVYIVAERAADLIKESWGIV